MFVAFSGARPRRDDTPLGVADRQRDAGSQIAPRARLERQPLAAAHPDRARRDRGRGAVASAPRVT